MNQNIKFVKIFSTLPKSKIIICLLLIVQILLYIYHPVSASIETILKFNHVSLDKNIFNPKDGEHVRIFFHLSAQALVTIKIFDRYGNLIRNIEDGYKAQKGSNKVSWDGRNINGDIVPDEAYSFIIFAEGTDGKKAEYNPIQDYGETVKINKLQLKPIGGKITYTLPFPSRVLIRLGALDNGPFYKTLVNWEPRCAGDNTEYWDGWDESRNVYLLENDNIIASYQAYTLPKNSIITKGNPVSQKDLEKLNLIRKRAFVAGGYEEKLTTIGPICPPEKRSPYADPNLIISRDIGLILSPLNSGETSIRHKEVSREHEFITQITIPGWDIPFLGQEPFELIFFIDNRYLEEIETASATIPYEYKLDTSSLEPGEHILTVNIIGLKNHLGTASIKINIE